jgi:hypothetical protein
VQSWKEFRYLATSKHMRRHEYECLDFTSGIQADKVVVQPMMSPISLELLKFNTGGFRNDSRVDAFYANSLLLDELKMHDGHVRKWWLRNNP